MSSEVCCTLFSEDLWLPAQLKTSSGLLDDFLICEEDAHPSASSLALPEVTKATPASGSGERSSSDELSSSESHLTPFGALAQDRTETESPTSTLTAAPSQGFTSSMWGNPMGFGAFNPMMMAMHPMHAMQQMQWMWEQQQRMQQAWAMGGPGMGMVPNCMQPQTPLPPASNEQPSAAKAAAASQAQADKAGKQQAQAAGAGQSSKRRQAAQQQKKQQQQSEQAEQQQADRHDKAAAEAAAPEPPAKKQKGGANTSANGEPRRTICLNCGAHQTPQWRCGPHGPRTLCNACGVRYKKGLPLAYLTQDTVAAAATAAAAAAAPAKAAA